MTPTPVPLLNPDVAVQAARWQQAFAQARPFRHVVIDDFLAPDIAQALLDTFPAFERGNSVGDDGRQGNKSVLERIRGLGGAWAGLDDAIQSPALLQWLGTVTGIDDLLYDPFYLGGGTHENRHGQALSAHIDFNYHPSERWHRRLNLIVYLNPEWAQPWGGNLELYRDPYAEPTPQVKVVPAFNRCVIFETTEHSWHAFDPIQLPEDKRDLSRRSIALYFYSRERPAEETAGRHTTHYVDAGLPAHLHAGHTLSEADLQALQQIVAQRDQRLRDLYAENARLLQAQDRGIAGHLLYLAKRLYVRSRR